MITSEAREETAEQHATESGVGSPEVLIQEARAHRRNRLVAAVAVNTLAACLVVALVIATGGSAGQGSPGHTVTLPPIQGATPVDLAEGLPSTMTAAELVSCSHGACVVVGNASAKTRPTIRPIARLYRGDHWTALPSPHGWSGYQLQGLSCSNPRSCVLTGYYFTGSPRGFTRAFAEVLGGGRWTPEQVPVPRSALSSDLDAVSCPSPRWCMATGTDWTGEGNHLFASEWNGARWKLVTVPLPTNTLVGGPSDLASISCVSSAWCMGVGSTSVSLSNEDLHLASASEPLAEVWTSGRWRLSSAPISSGLSRRLERGTDFQNSGLSCISREWCAASGSGSAAISFAGGGFAELATWNGHSWRSVLRTAWYVTKAGPNTVSEREAPRIGVEEAALGSMSCSSSTRCVSYVTNGGAGRLVIFELDGGRWHETDARARRPGPLMASSTSCLSSGACLVVGNYASIHSNTAQTGAFVFGVAPR